VGKPQRKRELERPNVDDRITVRILLRGRESKGVMLIELAEDGFQW
jgi:hypothetical protein